MDRAKKACRSGIAALVFLAAMLLLPGMRAEAVTANEKTAFEFFTDTMGLSPAAACGIMANIKCESGFTANITGGGGSYGICQWLGPRKSRLLSWCAKKGYKASSLKGQLNFLQYELKTYYPRVNNYLKSVSNSSSGAYSAGYYFCYYFEVPLNTYSSAVYRGRVAQNTYWKSLGVSTTYVTAAGGKGIKLTWNGSSKYIYQVRRAASAKGSYSVIATIAAGAKRTYTDKTAAAGKTYYYYIQPLTPQGERLGPSNKVSCSAKPSLENPACGITLAKTEYTYNGKACCPRVKVTYNGTVLKSGTHYTVAYTDNKNAGTVTVKVTGKGKYCGSVKISFVIRKAEQKIKASAVNTVMKSGLVSVKATAKGKISLYSEDPSVAAVKKGKLALKKPGITRITVKAAATKNYKAADKTITLTVKPAKMAVSGGTSPSSGKAVLKWKKKAGLDGYELQYTTSVKFTSGAKIVTCPGTAGSCTVAGLSGGKTVRFRLRGYVLAEGKKLYGDWSKVRTVKVKK